MSEEGGCGFLLLLRPTLHFHVSQTFYCLVYCLGLWRARVRPKSPKNFGRTGNGNSTLGLFSLLTLSHAHARMARGIAEVKSPRRGSQTGNCQASAVLMLVAPALVLVAHGRITRRLGASSVTAISSWVVKLYTNRIIDGGVSYRIFGFSPDHQSP